MSYLLAALHTRLTVMRNDDPERGDVPGWVMVTLMTAGLVLAIWGIAETQLKDLFSAAIAKVTSGKA